jgi:hypothetical protein
VEPEPGDVRRIAPLAQLDVVQMQPGVGSTNQLRQ